MLSHKSRSKTRGVTIIELAVILVIVTIALAPIVNMIGGPRSNDGNLTRTTGHQTKQVIFANSMIERALSGDTVAIQCEGAMGGLPSAGNTESCQGTFSQYSKPIYYEWVVRNLSDTLPDGMGNELYDATLNVYTDSDYATSIATFPIKVFNNLGPDEVSPEKTGILISIDISGSMALNSIPGMHYGGNVTTNCNPVDSPYLEYRYEDPAHGYIPPGVALNLFNDSELDVVSFEDTNTSDTPWDDRYPQPGILSMPGPNCNSSSYYNSVLFKNASSAVVKALCNADDSGTPIEDVYGFNMSRIEAARTSLFKFLIDIESDSELYNNIALGFSGFDGHPTPKLYVPTTVTGDMEEADVDGKYPEMRRKFSWINRNGPGAIIPSGSTYMWYTLYKSGQIIFNNMEDETIDNGIVFILTDGRISSNPCIGHSDSYAVQLAAGECFKTNSSAGGGSYPLGADGLVNSFARGTFPGHPGKTLKIFALGLLDDDVNVIRPLFEEGMTKPTGGAYKYSPTTGDMDAIFEDLKYAILKEVLISKVNRYGIDMD